MNSGLKLANAPVSWGVDHMGRPNLPPWRSVFTEIAQAGFLYTELGPLGYLPQDPDAIRSGMKERTLSVVGAALLEPLADPTVRQQSLTAARRLSRLIAETGGSFMVIVDWVTPERDRTAGKSSIAPRLKGNALRDFHSTFERIGEISKEVGVQSVAHSHGGTYLEFEDEIEALLASTDPDLVQLAIDTGHSTLAGFDPTALYRRHPHRTTYINFKDVSWRILDRLRSTKMTFLEAVDAGVFCQLGGGIVDFPAFVAELNENRFDGPAVIEQDRDPSAPGNPLIDAILSIEFLKSVGLVASTAFSSVSK
jgi:inosose dehydratase